MTKQPTLIIILILSLCLYNCKESEKVLDDKIEILKVLKIWNQNHNTKDLNSLANQYNTTVNYYGKEKSQEYIRNDKSTLFDQYKDFKQLDIEISEVYKDLINNKIKISFLKKVTVNSIDKDYPSYLVFKKVANEWKIIEENDLVTSDINFKKEEINKAKKIQGDFNGDGEKEYAWIVDPKRLLDSDYIFDESKLEEGELYLLQDEYIGGTKAVIHFSNKNIWPITVNSSMSELSTLGDLNNDGSDDILVYSSGRRNSALRVINANNYYKPEIIDPLFVNRNIFDTVQKEDMLKIVSPNIIKVTYSEFSDSGEYKLITKEIKL
ncbi:hypothetical protein M4I21_01595 [Cellulophaga sp. 20_2_10]|uniref:hypothetical protein n=1 Tax=Cellulophaga sp. 20_2_10 TaxID=2942476 RepID=UPI00201A7049|nr:hypothetical protein [Cellulophaga sp. 20_2_10]MCL5244481.1 hypothetical protein [Cellulophaga sp. 20_2_10]